VALSKCIAAAVVTSFSVAVSTVSQQSVMMDHFLIKDQVTMAEIIWTLHGIMSHSSVQGNISAADLFHLTLWLATALPIDSCLASAGVAAGPYLYASMSIGSAGSPAVASQRVNVLIQWHCCMGQDTKEQELLRCCYGRPMVSSSFFFFPHLISVVADWMSAILPHMVWP